MAEISATGLMKLAMCGDILLKMLLPVRHSANAAVAAWMNSDGQRDNLLNKEIEEIGVGLAIDDKSKDTYWIQKFVNPASNRNNYAL